MTLELAVGLRVIEAGKRWIVEALSNARKRTGTVLILIIYGGEDARGENLELFSMLGDRFCYLSRLYLKGRVKLFEEGGILFHFGHEFHDPGIVFEFRSEKSFWIRERFA